jgi:hypothetical protein
MERRGERRHRTKLFVFFVSLVYTTRLHALFKKADELSHLVIGAAIEVDRLKGPGLLEMNLLNIPLGLIINVHEMKLVDGVVRMILPGANWEA